jgi:hypothetical protein
LWGGEGPNWRCELASFLEEERHSWKVPKQASKPSFAKVVHQSSINPIFKGANAIPLGGARAVLIGASVVPRGRTPLTHPPLIGANAVPQGHTPPVHRAVFSRFPLPKGSAFVHPPFILSSGVEVQPWLPSLAPDASPLATSDGNAGGQLDVVLAMPRGMSLLHALCLPSSQDMKRMREKRRRCHSVQ